MPKNTQGKKRNESGEEISLSQSSNLEGNEEAMSLLIKAQATVAKNKKAKESQHLNSAKEVLNNVLGACAQDYAAAVGELEELYQAFQMELAASYDRERNMWVEVVAEQQAFKKTLDEFTRTFQEAEEAREKEHIEALAAARLGVKNAGVAITKTMSQ